MIMLWEMLTIYAFRKTDITPKYKFVILIASPKQLWDVCRNNFAVKKKMEIGSVS